VTGLAATIVLFGLARKLGPGVSRALTQVRHETMENSANPFRMSSGNR
jgi:hypothetical protein